MRFCSYLHISAFNDTVSPFLAHTDPTDCLLPVSLPLCVFVCLCVCVCVPDILAARSVKLRPLTAPPPPLSQSLSHNNRKSLSSITQTLEDDEGK